jgi:hypothetical protein
MIHFTPAAVEAAPGVHPAKAWRLTRDEADRGEDREAAGATNPLIRVSGLTSRGRHFHGSGHLFCDRFS